MRFAFGLLACLLGCARVAGLDDLEVRRDDTGAPLSPDANDTGAACDAAATSPSCGPGMVTIPGGCFIPRNGSDVVIVEPFCVDATEVTIESYLGCVDRGACPAAETTVTRPPGVGEAEWASYNALCNINISANRDHPINCIDALAAETECTSRGARLPTEAEWEWIAHGGPADTVYPWGNQVPTDQPCWKRNQTCVVASRRDTNPFGVHDLAGNVGEWTSTVVGAMRRARGGAFLTTVSRDLTFSGDVAPDARFNSIGYRCAK